MGSALRGVVLLAVASSACAKDFYVSPEGDDRAKGSKRAPFATLERARDAVRDADSAKSRTVVLLPGRYFRDKTLELDARDSGSAEKPIVFKAKKPGTVFIDGGVTVPGLAVQPVSDPAIRERLIADVRDDIVQIDLKKLGITDYGTFGPRGFRRAYIPAPLELSIDTNPQTIARWPNKGEDHIKMGKVIEMGSVPRSADYSMHPGTFEYNVDRPKRWTKAKELYLSGIFNYGYADDTLRVTIDPERGTFTSILPHLYGFAKRSFTAWFAINLIEEIDQPGEYCVDTESGLLLFLPPKGFSKGSLIQLSMMEDVMVAMEGAEHVHFENMTFENARGTAVYLERGTGNVLAGCTFRNLGIMAVQMGLGIEAFPYGKHDGCGFKEDGNLGVPVSRELGSWHEHIYLETTWDRQAGTNHRILSCDIYNTGAGGVLLGGGDRKNLVPANNSVENCDIYQVNRLERTYKAPINVDGVGNLILNNWIHDCEGMGVYLHGNDHMVEYNRFFNLLSDMSDQGAIYMGRDPSESGNVFRYNFFHDIINRHKGGHGVQGIFFDDMCTFGATIYGNVFLRAGSTGVVKFHGGGESPIINNIMIDCPRGLQKGNCSTKRVVGLMKGELGQKRLIQDLDITKPPHSTKYPVVTAIYNGERELQFPYERNYEIRAHYAEFVDPANWNFALKDDSVIYERIEGFEKIPFEKMGLYKDAYRKKLPAELPPCELADSKSNKDQFPAHTLFLGDMKAVKMDTHGGPRINAAYSNVGPVVLKNETYAQSIMLHPVQGKGKAVAEYDLPKGKFKQFKAVIAIDDAVRGKGSVVFIVEAKVNGQFQEIFKSGVIKGKSKPQEISVDIAGATAIRITVTNAGDNNDADHAVLANARFE